MSSKSTSKKENAINESISNELKPYVEKLTFAEKISNYLVSKYGKPNTPFYVVFAGAGSLFILMAAWLQSPLFFFIGIFFLLFSKLFYDIRIYYLSKLCKKCGKEFAYSETREPSIINSYSSISTIVVYHRCKYCGHELEERKNIVAASEMYTI